MYMYVYIYIYMWMLLASAIHFWSIQLKGPFSGTAVMITGRSKQRMGKKLILPVDESLHLNSLPSFDSILAVWFCFVHETYGHISGIHIDKWWWTKVIIGGYTTGLLRRIVMQPMIGIYCKFTNYGQYFSSTSRYPPVINHGNGKWIMYRWFSY